MIVNARMYSVTPAATEGWQTLLREAVRRAGLSGEVLAYPPSARLERLWARTDLLAVFMCGWPFAQRLFPVQPVAVPKLSMIGHKSHSREAMERCNKNKIAPESHRD